MATKTKTKAIDATIRFSKAMNALSLTGVDPPVAAQRLVDKLCSFQNKVSDANDPDNYYAVDGFADCLDPDQVESVIDWLSEIRGMQP